jgi:uncharacterized membrane protein (UPF0127 family)
VKPKNICLNYKGKKLSLEVFGCNIAERGRGLMFRGKKNARALMFDLKEPTNEPIHSFFVFFKFLAVWCDEKNNILEIRVIKPFKPYIRCKHPWVKLIEIPMNSVYSKEIKFLCSQSPSWKLHKLINSRDIARR